MKLLYDVDSQQGPDLLLHDLICKKRHTDEMKPCQTLTHTVSHPSPAVESIYDLKKYFDRTYVTHTGSSCGTEDDTPGSRHKSSSHFCVLV